MSDLESHISKLWLLILPPGRWLLITADAALFLSELPKSARKDLVSGLDRKESGIPGIWSKVRRSHTALSMHAGVVFECGFILIRMNCGELAHLLFALTQNELFFLGLNIHTFFKNYFYMQGIFGNCVRLLTLQKIVRLVKRHDKKVGVKGASGLQAVSVYDKSSYL